MDTTCSEEDHAERILLKWREPKAYVRKGFSRGRWIGLAVIFLIPAILLGIDAYTHGLNRSRTIKILLFAVFGTYGFFGVRLGSGRVVRLKRDCVTTSGPYAYFNRIPYARIDSCKMFPTEYNGQSFSVLRFAFKNRKFFTFNEVAVPQEVGLDEILKIFRERGVKIVKE